MHAAAGHAIDGLGHEGGVEAVEARHGLHRQLEGEDVVRRFQRLGILEVDLVLPVAAFVVAGLDFEAHLLQGQADLAPRLLPVVQRAHVEIGAFVIGLQGGTALFIGLKEVELTFRAHVEGIAHGSSLAELLLQHITGVAHEGGPVGIVHIADEAGHAAQPPVPGQKLEGLRVGPEILVALMDADKALDGRAVKGDLVVHGLLDLRGGDGHVLQLPEDVRDLQADEAHILLPHHADDLISVHSPASSVGINDTIKPILRPTEKG